MSIVRKAGTVDLRGPVHCLDTPVANAAHKAKTEADPARSTPLDGTVLSPSTLIRATTAESSWATSGQGGRAITPNTKWIMSQ